MMINNDTFMTIVYKHMMIINHGACMMIIKWYIQNDIMIHTDPGKQSRVVFWIVISWPYGLKQNQIPSHESHRFISGTSLDKNKPQGIQVL